MNSLGKLFNEYEDIFNDLSSKSSHRIMIDVSIRFRLFGCKDEMMEQWRIEHPDIAVDNIYFISLSSNPIEIWGLIRKETEYGKLIINHLSLGHEVNHALRIALSGWTLNSEHPALDTSPMLSPDYYINI